MVHKEIYIELQDTQWQFDYIDHDRNIARAIVYDENGIFYFVRAERDDDFGKATLIETAGGGVEVGEELQTAIQRELKEELGVCKNHNKDQGNQGHRTVGNYANNDKQHGIEVSELHAGQVAIQNPVVGCAANLQGEVDDVIAVPNQQQENYRAHHQIGGILGINVKPGTVAAVKLPHKVQQHQPDSRPDENLIHGRGSRKVSLERVHITVQRTEYRCGCQIQQIHHLRCQPIHNAV